MSIGKAEQLGDMPFEWNRRHPVKPGLRKREKQRKSRHERRKARQNPEAVPTYGKYAGWWW